MSRAVAVLLAAGSLLVGAAASADTLYGVGSGAPGSGGNFKAILPAGSSTAIGDGTAAFNGGLAYSTSAGRMFAIANSPLGTSTLTSFTLASPASLSKPVTLGTGFTGGLAYDTDNSSLYAIASNAAGVSTFYAVGAGGATAIGTLGSGFIGGLTYDSSDHSFYAIATGSAATPSKVCRVGLTLGTFTVDTLFDLNGGSTSDRVAAFAAADDRLSFLGGIVWNPNTGGFLTLATDGDGTSAVYSFTLNGAPTLTKVASIGPVDPNIGLAFAPDTPPISAVPEPSTAVLLVAGAALLLAWRRHGARTVQHS